MPMKWQRMSQERGICKSFSTKKTEVVYQPAPGKPTITVNGQRQTVYKVLFVLEFYGPVNNEVMSSRSVNSGTVPGQV